MKSDTKYPFEYLFRSIQYALVDNACREYLFLSELFMLEGQNAQDLFNMVFNKTTQILTKHVDTYVQVRADNT